MEEDKLKRRMRDHRVSTYKIADELGVSQPQAYRMIRGKRRLSKARRTILVRKWRWMAGLLPRDDA